MEMEKHMSDYESLPRPTLDMRDGQIAALKMTNDSLELLVEELKSRITIATANRNQILSTVHDGLLEWHTDGTINDDNLTEEWVDALVHCGMEEFGQTHSYTITIPQIDISVEVKGTVSTNWDDVQSVLESYASEFVMNVDEPDLSGVECEVEYHTANQDDVEVSED